MNETPQAESDAKALRGAFSNFLTGVTIVCTVDPNGNARGFTANSFTSVSLDPPLILICIAKTASSYEAFRQCKSFSVNVLGESQRELSTIFATKAPDKFSNVDIRYAKTGAPIIVGSLSWFDCTAFNYVEAGDHIILVGRVESFVNGQGAPLGFWRGNYVTFESEAEAMRVETPASAYVSCLLDWRGRVLLCRGEDKTWTFPAASTASKEGNHQARLDRLLSKLEVEAEINFLFSVFEAASRGETYIVYRGTVTSPPSETRQSSGKVSFFTDKDLPWDDLPAPEFRVVLERYFRERDGSAFSVYSDAGLDGSIAALDSQPKHWRD